MFYKIINKKKRMATRIADAVGYALWAPAAILRRNLPPRKEEVKEILVVRTAYIGDVIMTLPMLKPLKERYPGSRITFLTANAAKDLFKDSPYVDEVIAYDAFWFYKKSGTFRDFLKRLRSRRFDIVIEARADIRDIFLIAYMSRSRWRVSYKVGGGGYLLTDVVPFKEIRHKVDYHLDIVRFLGAAVDSIDWGIKPSDEEMRKVDSLLLEEGIGDSDTLIGIHPGARKDLKRWSMDGFKEVGDRLASEYGCKIVFTGSSQENELIEDIIKGMANKAVNLAGKTSLRTLPGLMKRFTLFVCNDSAPLHIASAMNTPTVAVFGPSKSKETGPYGNIHRVVERDFPCRSDCDEDICRHIPFKECMEKITVEDVLSAAGETLNECGRIQYGVKS